VSARRRDIVAAEAHDPLTGKVKPQWLVICSCGWTREAISEWAAKSISKLHPQIAPMDVSHVVKVEGSEPGEGQQLTLEPSLGRRPSPPATV
jgi:hypothetical protein